MRADSQDDNIGIVELVFPDQVYVKFFKNNIPTESESFYRNRVTFIGRGELPPVSPIAPQPESAELPLSDIGDPTPVPIARQPGRRDFTSMNPSPSAGVEQPMMPRRR